MWHVALIVDCHRDGNCNQQWVLGGDGGAVAYELLHCAHPLYSIDTSRPLPTAYRHSTMATVRPALGGLQ
jgi:hypothetical protein